MNLSFSNDLFRDSVFFYPHINCIIKKLVLLFIIIQFFFYKLSLFPPSQCSFMISLVSVIPLVHIYFWICNKCFITCQLRIWVIISLFLKRMLEVMWEEKWSTFLLLYIISLPNINISQKIITLTICRLV